MKKNKRKAVFILLALLLVILTSCGGGGGGGSSSPAPTPTGTVQAVTCPASGATNVSIVDFAFNPASVTVPLNTTVKWTNNGQTIHTVTSTTVPANGAFDSGNLAPGQSVCFQFTATGAFNYFCKIHLFTGLVTVQ